MFEQIQEATRAIQAKWSGKPQIGIILGTGLGALAEEIESPVKIAYEDIPHFPHSTVKSHAGRFVCGTLSGKGCALKTLRAVFVRGRIVRYAGRKQYGARRCRICRIDVGGQ